MQKALPRQQKYLAIIVAILLLGFFLRTTGIGELPLVGDEAWNAWLSYDFGQNGHRSELGVVSSSGANQPPFFYDLFAIPFAFSPDPRIARLFMAILQLISLPILYRLVSQFWGPKTGLVAVFLYAVVMPRAVWAGRAIWNPYLFLPFVIIFYLAGFWLITNKTKRKTWARWALVPALGFVIQSHPITICTTILVPLFFARDWQLTPQCKRGKMLRAHAIGVAFAALTFVPWGVGYIHQQMTTPSDGHMNLRNPSPFDSITNDVLTTQTHLDSGGYGLLGDDYTDPGQPWATLYYVIGAFNIIGAVILILNMRKRFEDGVVGIAFLVMPIFSYLSPTRTYGHYLIIDLPTIAIIEAILLTRLAQHRRLAVVAGAAFAVLVGGQFYDLLNGLRQVRDFNDPQTTQGLSLDQTIQFRNQLAAGPNEVIYSMNHDFTHALLWQTLGPKYQSRVVWENDLSLPVPADGVTYVDVTPEADTALPPSYLKKASISEYGNFYRMVTLPPQTQITPTCGPQVPAAHFSNGATLLGYYIEPTEYQRPLAKQPWTIYLVWKVTPAGNVQDHQIFVHLVDETGLRYAQTDFQAISPTIWHPGDEIVSKVTLTPPPDLPHEELLLHVGMYTLPETKNFDLYDNKGNDLGQWATVPLCSTF